MYVTSLCSAESNLGDVVADLSNAGFDKIEFTGNIRYEPGIETEVLELQESGKFDVCIHNYFPPQPSEFVLNLASQDPTIKAQSRALISQAVSLSEKLGKSLFTCHPGFRHNLLPRQHNHFFVTSDTRPCIEDDFYASVDELLSGVLPLNFRLGIENLSPKSSDEAYSFLTSDRDIEHFLDNYKKENRIGLLLDLGHLEVAAFLCGFNHRACLDRILRDHASRIFEIHVSENNGRQDSHGVTSPDSWQIDFLQNNRTVLRQAQIVFEWHNAATAAAFKRYATICERLAL
jgi:sugar phosphate isomerase/epimerase